VRVKQQAAGDGDHDKRVANVRDVWVGAKGVYCETGKCENNQRLLENTSDKTVSSADCDALLLDSFQISETSLSCELCFRPRKSVFSVFALEHIDVKLQLLRDVALSFHTVAHG
jgi:hypothetical protein